MTSQIRVQRDLEGMDDKREPLDEQTERNLHAFLINAGYQTTGCRCLVCRTLQPLILNWDSPRWR